MQVAALLSSGHSDAPPLSVAYVSGEESTQQLRQRASRLGVGSAAISVLNETDLGAVLDQLAPMPGTDEPAFDILIVDSVQTMYMDDVTSAAGSVSQVKACAMQLLQLAKSTGVTVFLVGHVTKSGDLAGPRVLEHLVDTVLYIEGDSTHGHRLVRTEKNRFGSTSEVGIFEMDEQGLVEVDDPAGLFITSAPNEDGWDSPAGAVVSSTMEGSRAMCVEVQALCTDTTFEFPRHRSSGIQLERVFMLLAVLRKHAGVRIGRKDLFVNVVGGLRLTDPAVDLATAVSIASSVKEEPVPRHIAFIGEVGLGGELRPVPHTQQRLAAAAQLGFTHCVLPAPPERRGGMGKARVLGRSTASSHRQGTSRRHDDQAGTHRIEQVPVKTLRQALKVAFG